MSVEITALAPWLALAVSSLGVVSTLVYCGRTFGRLEQRLESAEKAIATNERAVESHAAQKGHAGSLELVADLRERTAVLEGDRAHTREVLDSLRVEINEMRRELREALGEVRADMRKLVGNDGR